jgi:hypothetical protein
MEHEETRKHKRYRTNLPVKLFIVLPEETFQPQEKHAIVQNISLSGMKIHTRQCDEALYKNLLKTVRYAKIVLTPPGARVGIHLHGRIVWLNYSSQGKDLELGIFFERIAPQDQKIIWDMINQLEQESLPPGNKQAQG